MEKDIRQRGGSERGAGAHDDRHDARPAPGKVTRTSKLPPSHRPASQRAEAAPASGTPGPQARSAWDLTMDPWMDAAYRGCTALAEQEQRDAHGPLGTFPHQGAIAASMGVAPAGRAIVDPDGCAAAKVEAFTRGDTAHFATEAPPLRVAAHEAAHLAQHAGLTRDRGMGAERHADAIAAEVAAGGSATGLLGSQGATVDDGFHAYTRFDVAAQTSGGAAGWQDPAGQTLKVADDGKAALSYPGYGDATLAWALPAEISRSEEILAALGSRVKLRAGAVDISGKNPVTGTGATTSLARIVIEDRAGATTTTLADDCGLAMHEALGSANHGNEAHAATRAGSREAYTSRRTYHGGYGGAPDNTTPELWFEEILAQHFGAGKTRAEYYARYDAMNPAERAAFARQYGINAHAVPGVGQGITTFAQFDMPGWAAKPGHATDTWNFHYAASILTSGSDYLSIENYAGHGASNWFLDMIGPASKGQSFDQAHGASDQFGTDWGSLVVQPAQSLEGTLDIGGVHLVKDPARWSPNDSRHPGNLIAKLPRGTRIRILEKDTSWWRIEVTSGAHAAKTGWISRRHFEIS